MFNYYDNYYSIMPTITIYSNCDTALTLNLSCFSFAPQEQLIFVIKNHDYTEAPAEFVHRITTDELNSDKNVSFIVPKTNATNIKTGAIYTFMTQNLEGQCSKMTPNGRVKVEYGAHQLNFSINEEDVNNG